MIENLMCALVEFINNMKHESLFEMCKLGREICERLVDIFGQRQITLVTKVC